MLQSFDVPPRGEYWVSSRSIRQCLLPCPTEIFGDRPPTFDSWFHPLLPRFLFRVPSFATPARSFRSDAYLPGSLALGDITAARPATVSRQRGGSQLPNLFPSLGFLNLSTACSGHRLRGLVSSHSHSGFASEIRPKPPSQPPPQFPASTTWCRTPAS